VVSSVLLAADFVLDDLIGVSWDAIDSSLALGQSTPFAGKGWTESSVQICVPLGVKHSKRVKKKAHKGHAAAGPPDGDGGGGGNGPSPDRGNGNKAW
jgi:hypothetical protein